MYYSSLKFHKYKINQRNVQTPSIKIYRTKTYSTKYSPTIKHSNSYKSYNKFHNNSNNTLEVNSIDLEKSNNFFTSNSNHSVKNISIQKGISSLFDNNKIYSSIISKIEHLKNLHKYNKMNLYYILTKIEKFINNFFKKTDCDNDKNSLKDINIKENINRENQEFEINILRKRIDKLQQKLIETEKKFKIERLNYLFCIGENQNKIAELEKIINMKSIDKMPKSELNKVICYPQYSKFDVTDEINPKSIPMFLSAKNKKIQSPKCLPKNESQISQDKTNFNRLFQTEFKKIKHSFSSSFDYSNKKEDINKNDSENDAKEKEEENHKSSEKRKEVNEVIESGQKYFEDNIRSNSNLFKNSKNYFLTHPKLDYIKNINSRNNIVRFKFGHQVSSLPKQIGKLTTISNTQKKTFVVFPSFLNETLLNIEKLKTNKNFRSIDNKFEDAHKMKIHSND